MTTRPGTTIPETDIYRVFDEGEDLCGGRNVAANFDGNATFEILMYGTRCSYNTTKKVGPRCYACLRYKETKGADKFIFSGRMQQKGMKLAGYIALVYIVSQLSGKIHAILDGVKTRLGYARVTV